MKRAEAEVIRSPFFQFDEGADHFNDIDAALNLLYGLLTDQGTKIILLSLV